MLTKILEYPAFRSLLACTIGAIMLAPTALAQYSIKEVPKDLPKIPMHIQEVLDSIEKNNPSLKVAQAEMEAEKLTNKGEEILPDPEVEFNYLWGANGIGNRHDVRVTQSFDFPTISGMRHSLVKGKGELAYLKYKADRQGILLSAKLNCIDLVYYNALVKELSTHLGQAKSQVRSFEKKIKVGDANVMDLNKAKVHLTSVQGKLSGAEVERQRLLAELKSMNGGIPIYFNAAYYELGEDLPTDFEAWFQAASEKNPSIQYVRKAVEVDKKQLSIDKTSWIPELSVGYMSEIAKEDKYRGLTLGVIIPLWTNANKVKQAKARLTAAKSRQTAAEQKFYYMLQSQYAEAASLKATSEMMRQALIVTDNRNFLLEAQSKGEISMVEYLVEIDQYYEAIEQTLATERNYRHVLAQLNAVEL
ncbi:MAG: TolC family protein [Bacteroidales bacterium]|nr:TolC family protein [Bacteroidales bacterium]MDY6000823.1 TolC family protein [Candidatus Cryptobacteroides sp.]